MDVEARPANAHRVMVVDDNMDELALLSTFVQLSGYEVKTARDGMEALRVAEDFHPEVVLMDLGMPRLDGLEAAKSIRRQPWGREIRLIALSGWAHVKDKRRTREAGFDEGIVKPVELAELSRALRQAWA